MADDPMFDERQARDARLALRAELDLGEERFPLPAFVAMISDEVGQLREAGHDDAGIARMIADATGQEIDPAELERHYVPPEERH